ncbi:Uncharacterised protein [uncultured archaeon]|nr:Uncharacterised protein [uncultured archaeon]
MDKRSTYLPGRKMKGRSWLDKWGTELKISLFIIIAVVTVDVLIIHTLIPSPSISFIARLCWNAGIVAGAAATYLLLKRSTYLHGAGARRQDRREHASCFSTYLRGVGAGLIISWVTGALAYFKAGASTDTTLIQFELILSVIFILLAYLIDTEKGKRGNGHSKGL